MYLQPIFFLFRMKDYNHKPRFLLPPETPLGRFSLTFPLQFYMAFWTGAALYNPMGPDIELEIKI